MSAVTVIRIRKVERQEQRARLHGKPDTVMFADHIPDSCSLMRTSITLLRHQIFVTSSPFLMFHDSDTLSRMIDLTALPDDPGCYLFSDEAGDDHLYREGKKSQKTGDELFPENRP